MSTTLTVLVVLDDQPHALARLLARCHRRGWTPTSLRYVSDGTSGEVVMRLIVPSDRRGTEAQVRKQLDRLVETRHVLVELLAGVPDDIAFANLRRKGRAGSSLVAWPVGS
jgi:acetolactate synthase regulatory subunit